MREPVEDEEPGDAGAHVPEDRVEDRPEEEGDLKVDLLRARLLDVDQLQTLPPPEPLIADVLTKNTLAVLWGKPGSGKSFTALDWALSVGTGTWWFGHEVRQGLVLYLAAEGASGLRQRVNAWMSDRCIYRVERDQLRLLTGTVNLLDKQWARALVDLSLELRPTLVIADTLARVMVGGDENTSRDMGQAIDAANQVQNATGASVLFVHHDTKEGSTMRGSSALLGAVDTSIECKADGAAVTLKCEKQKDDAPFQPIRMWRQEVGESCVFRSHEAVGPNEERTKAEETLLQAAWDCAGTDGLPPSELMKVSELSHGSYYRAQKALLSDGLLVNVGTEKRPRYRAIGGGEK